MFKPAPGHNPRVGPGVCGCVECCRKLLKLRCPVVIEGQQCGLYNHREKVHVMIPATVWAMAEERIRLDG